MSEMIDRVAQALYTKRNGSAERVPWSEIVAFFQIVAEEYRELARTAIEAMMEPTEEMIDTCSDPWGDPMGTTRGCWQSMIEVALH